MLAASTLSSTHIHMNDYLLLAHAHTDTHTPLFFYSATFKPALPIHTITDTSKQC